MDTQIQDPGFVPPGDYGMEPADPTVSSTPPPQRQTQPRATNYQQPAPKPQAWKSSEKQGKLIDKLITELKITLSALESVAQHRFRSSEQIRGISIIQKSIHTSTEVLALPLSHYFNERCNYRIVDEI